MNMDLYNTYVLKLSHTKSITQAATELNISQPALSMALSQLEKKLGFSIFNRKTTPISITEAGKIYLDFINKQLINETEYNKKIENLFAASNITIGAPNVYIDSIISPSISKIIETIPNLHLKIESKTIPEMADLCQQAKIDFFISTVEMKDSNFINIPISEEITYLCIPPKYANSDDTLLSDKQILSKALEKMPFIFLYNNQPLQISFNNTLKKLNIKKQPTVTVNQVTSALSLASKGVAVCIATSEAIKCNNNISDLYLYPFSDYIPPRIIYAVYSKNCYISPACIDIINILKEESKNALKIN